MRPDVYWIDLPLTGRLAIMPRPRAGDWLDDAIAGWGAAGIDVVVSVLEPAEIVELDLGREADLCRGQGIAFVTFPIADRNIPASYRAVDVLVQGLVTQIHDGMAIAVHCRAGIGRSALIAACVLVRFGYTPDIAFQAIGSARGTNVPDTEQQRAWVAEFLELPSADVELSRL